MTSIKRIPTPHTYSAAVAVGDQVYLALHRGFGETFAEQFEGTLDGMKSTLAELGLTVDCLVKVNVWLKNIDDLPLMEKLFSNHFAPGNFPARMTATTAFIDDDCLLMIDGIGYNPVTAS
jgi:2-iminobutanoate/2-iminopropanoate deaminase